MSRLSSILLKLWIHRQPFSVRPVLNYGLAVGHSVRGETFLQFIIDREPFEMIDNKQKINENKSTVSYAEGRRNKVTSPVLPPTIFESFY